MKPFRQFINETVPTVHANVAGAQGGFGSAGTSALGNAGYDPKLFRDPVTDDLLSQDYQTPGQSGLAKWRFSNVWPVEKLSMAGVDAQVAASKEFVELEAQKVVNKMKRTYQQFMGYR